MIKKERLEELIQKRATIWVANKYCYAYSVDLDINYIGIADGKDSLFTLDYSINDKGETVLIDYLEYLFETKEDAEEYAEFGDITRTERLELPSWSDIFPDKENHFYHGTYNYWWDDCCKYDIYINAFITDNNFEKGYFDINGHREFGITKESYTNIRRYAVKLFKGEEV